MKTATAVDLELFDKASESISEARAFVEDTVECMWRAGRDTEKLKSRTPRGEWGAVEEALAVDSGVGSRTIRNWRKLYRDRPDGLQEGDTQRNVLLLETVSKTDSPILDGVKSARRDRADELQRQCLEEQAERHKKRQRKRKTSPKPLNRADRLAQELEEERLKVEGYEHNADEATAAENLRLRQENEKLKEDVKQVRIANASLSKQLDTYKGQNAGLRTKLDALREALRLAVPTHDLVSESGAKAIN